MGKIKLSTKLTWGIVVLMTSMVVLTTVGIVYGVYRLTEQEIRASLVQDLKIVLTDHLTIENNKIKQQDKEQAQALGAFLRTKDLSLLIVTENEEILARYGIYRDLPDNYLKIEPVSQSVYKDLTIDEYGLFDTYIAPIKANGKAYGYLAIARKNIEIDILKKTIWAVGAVLLPLAWGLSLIIAYVMARWITRPMTRLVEYLEKIKIGSMQSITESSKMDYEVSVVVTAINDLIGRLKANLERERQMTENISHEFKTPLTRIASNLQVGKVQGALDEVIELGGNVDALLSLAIWEGTNEQCDLVPIIKHLAKLIPSNLKVEVAMPKKLITPLPYSHAIIVWRNILDNAIKHNKKDGYIRVVGKVKNDRWEVEVVNSTLSSIKVAKRVTERMYRQGTNAGHGIGMSIVADMCKLHALRLEVSESEGEVRVRISG